jgi:hypothetical protein
MISHPKFQLIIVVNMVAITSSTLLVKERGTTG